MFIKKLNEIPSFVAGDKTIIKEYAHPKNDPIDLNYSLAHAEVSVGEKSEPHILHNNSELYVILEGVGRLYIGSESAILRGGEAALVPKGEKQWIENIGDIPLCFYVIVSPPWQEETEEVLFNDEV
jgi:mannose-6-phosphate isomerase-like protein (cupin superfamily)